MWKQAGSRGTKFHPKCKHQGPWDQDLCPEAAVQIIETIHPRQRQKSKHLKKNEKRGKGLGFVAKGTCPPAWFPRRQCQRFLWAVKSHRGPGCHSLACHKCHVPRKFNQLPLGKFTFPPRNQILFKAVPTGQGKPDPTPNLSKKLVWEEQRRRRGGGGLEPPGQGASWGPGRAPRAPLSAPGQQHPPTLLSHRRPGPANHTGKVSPASGAHARTRVPGLP